MAASSENMPVEHRNFDNIMYSLKQETSLDDMVFGFPEDFEESPENSCDSSNKCDDIEDEQEEENSCNVEEKKAFWETQNQLLKSILYRSNYVETKVRNDTKEALKELNIVGVQCLCQGPVAGVCRNCLQREVCQKLCNRGHNCAICISKWRKSPNIPPGEHRFLEVLQEPSSKKGEIRIIIELNFRAEFEMARASEEYSQLIELLPDAYVGKSKRLREVIKILCKAAKKCMKERKMHMGPWRKHKYMQAKWLGTCEGTKPAGLMQKEVKFSNKMPKPKASMLTVDLLGTLPSMHRTAIKVL